MSSLSTGPFPGTVINNQHNKGRTWTDKGVFWDYTLTFNGALPMNGTIRAQTKEEALALLKARHQPDEEATAISIKVHDESAGRQI
jgi:hypothetical protein